MPSFNLIDQPWIPCIPHTGNEPVLLGLRDTLVHAHEHRELLDNSPLVTVALHRLLLAIIHRTLHGPRTTAEWQALREQERFDVQRISDYLESCRSRLDLFDSQRPFYQVPRMEDVNTISAATLAHEKASGNNSTLFDHTTNATGALTPHQAARYLVAFQAFALGGGHSEPFNLSDAHLTRDYTVLVRGETLFETLLLNLIRYTPEGPFPWLSDDDPPWWERNEHPTPVKAGIPPAGYLDYLTWQSRRIHLLYDEQAGLVRECQIRQNLKVALGPDDPFKAYSMTKERGWSARRLSESRAIWRDSHALLEVAAQAAEASERRPAIFDWIAVAQPSGIGRQRGNTRQCMFDVLGCLVDTRRATIILWRHDRLPLPLSYLTQRPLRDKLRGALSLAEEVSQLFKPTFGGAAQSRYPRPMRKLVEGLLIGISGRQPDTEAMTNLAQHFGAERVFWAALEPHFRPFMEHLAEAMEADGEEGGSRMLTNWATQVEACAHRVFREVCGGLDMSARALRATALAQQAFAGQLGELLTPYRIPSTATQEARI